MSDERKHHTSEEKVTILRRHLVDRVPVSTLCDEYQLHPTMFYRWLKQFFENGAAAFGPPPRADKGEAPTQRWRRKGHEGCGEWERAREKQPIPVKASLPGTSPAHESPLAIARSVAAGFARPISPIRIGIRAQAIDSVHG